MVEETPESGTYGLGRVAFKAHLKDIQNEVEAGYPMTHIYAKRKDKLGITYSQFARHVQRYIKGKTPVKRASKGIEEITPEPMAGTPPVTPFHKKFEFNPVAPQYDDLI